MEIEQYELSCNSCGVTFWITKRHENKLRRCHNTFYCPNGHSLYFSQETDGEKYKRLYNEEKKRAERNGQNYCDETDRTYRLEKSISAYKGVISKMRKKNVKNEKQN